MMSTHQLQSVPPLDRAETLLGETMDQVRQLPSRDDIRRSTRASARNRDVAIALALLFATVAVIASYFASLDTGKTAAQTAINSSSIKALEQARQDLLASGVPESELPALPTPLPGAEVDVAALVSATTSSVLAKIRNDPAFRGQAGIPGPPCDPVTNPECRGPQGVEGDQGPGPACDVPPSTCRGATGEMGAGGPVPVSASFARVNPDDPTSQCQYITVYRPAEGDDFSIPADTASNNCT